MVIKLHKIEEIFDFLPKSKLKAGKGLEEGKYPFYTSSPELTKYIDIAKYQGESSIFGTGGKASIHFAKSKFSTSTDCIVIQKKANAFIDTQYCYYYLKTNFQIIEKGFHGAGLKHISKDYIQKIKIPIPYKDGKPDLLTQKRIAKVLSDAEKLIAKRKESITLLDEFLKATFLEMFGDPVFNRKKWEVRRLDQVTAKITDGKHGDCIDEKGSGYYFLSAKDLINGKLKYHDVREIKKSEFEDVHKRTDLKLYDLLLGNTGASIGKIGIVLDKEKAQKTTFQKSISIITVKWDLINPFYLKAFFDYNRKLFVRSSSGSAMTNLLLSQIRAFKIQIPPLPLQNQFVEIVEKTEALKKQFEESLQELENLYGSLSQKAFKGELDLSRVEIEETETEEPKYIAPN